MKIALLIFIINFTLVAYSQKNYDKVADIKALEQKINHNAENVNSIKSDFIQVKKIRFLKDEITSRGKFWYKTENNLRWEYLRPFNYTIAITGNSFSIYDGNKVNTFDAGANPVFREVNDLIISIARGNMMKDGKFEVEAFENPGFYWLKMTPIDENMKKYISETEVFIDKSDLTVVRIIMKESETDYTEISFLNRKINEDIPDSIFILE